MEKTNLIQSIIQCGIATKQMSSFNFEDYKKLVSECRRNRIDVAYILKSIYMAIPETIQYQMWKDGYVDSCPADMLLNDIASEKRETLKTISINNGKNILHCEAYFENIQEQIIYHISNAKQKLKIAIAWFTNPQIFNRLLRACKRGITVELLINNDLINNRTNGLPFDKLIEAGAQLYIAEPPKLIHNKFCIIDDRIVIDGSYNWTILSEKNNDENIVIIENGHVIQSFINAFDNLTQHYERVDAMPTRVPERLEYDCCSYAYYNTEEWLEQIPQIGNKKKQRELHKEIIRLLPEDTAKQKLQLPNEDFEDIKKDVEEEKTRDEILFHKSLNKKSTELEKKLSMAKKKEESVNRRVEIEKNKKIEECHRYQSKVATVNTRSISQQQKEDLLTKIRRDHRTKLYKINKSLAKHSLQLKKQTEESDNIKTRTELIRSIKFAELEGSKGLCRINLKWNTADDLDLHLVLPGGTRDSEKDVYYAHKCEEYNGGICTLDHDAIPNYADENPQENIFWEKELPDGVYRVFVKLYNKKSNLKTIPFSITIFTGKHVETEAFCFQNEEDEYIEIAELTFKNGKVVTPIPFR